MQEEYREKILTYLDNKKRECFTGGVKIGFEHGRPSGISENLKPDPETNLLIKNDFNIVEQINLACTGDFFGTLIFVYDCGEVTHFNRIKTIQGTVLSKMLDERTAIQPRQKSRVVVGVRKPTNA
jgi:hypothetical protein